MIDLRIMIRIWYKGLCKKYMNSSYIDLIIFHEGNYRIPPFPTGVTLINLVSLFLINAVLDISYLGNSSISFHIISLAFIVPVSF